MPIVIMLALSILLAWLVVFLRRKSDELSQNFFGWLFLLLFAYETIAASPYLLYIFRFHGDWSLSYFLSPENFPLITTKPLLLSAAIVLLGYIVLIISYGYSRLTALSGHTVMLQLPWILSLAALATGIVLYRDRLLYVASFNDFWNGSGTLLHLSPVSWAFGGVVLFFILTICLSFKLK